MNDNPQIRIIHYPAGLASSVDPNGPITLAELDLGNTRLEFAARLGEYTNALHAESYVNVLERIIKRATDVGLDNPYDRVDLEDMLHLPPHVLVLIDTAQQHPY